MEDASSAELQSTVQRDSPSLGDTVRHLGSLRYRNHVTNVTLIRPRGEIPPSWYLNPRIIRILYIRCQVSWLYLFAIRALHYVASIVHIEKPVLEDYVFLDPLALDNILSHALTGDLFLSLTGKYRMIMAHDQLKSGFSPYIAPELCEYLLEYFGAAFPADSKRESFLVTGLLPRAAPRELWQREGDHFTVHIGRRVCFTGATTVVAAEVRRGVCPIADVSLFISCLSLFSYTRSSFQKFKLNCISLWASVSQCGLEARNMLFGGGSKGSSRLALV